VVQPRDHADLAREALGRLPAAREVEQLDGDRTLVLAVERSEHDGHAATTDLGLDVIAALERGPEPPEEVGAVVRVSLAR
jgi:hypothetical protein